MGIEIVHREIDSCRTHHAFLSTNVKLEMRKRVIVDTSGEKLRGFVKGSVVESRSHFPAPG